ncbi:hypothetical protein CC78DRAFT_586257 [Lojkania enalia]|uniref:Uncharacterized protein n=1 Tax=Lojkania enalia TaxID=147567 RepID=A0A9P4MYF7_9PLEO|nr:hypothetical protein CC78DRAFT_586257 [Didymosphaeria enalia]
MALIAKRRELWARITLHRQRPEARREEQTNQPVAVRIDLGGLAHSVRGGKGGRGTTHTVSTAIYPRDCKGGPMNVGWRLVAQVCDQGQRFRLIGLTRRPKVQNARRRTKTRDADGNVRRDVTARRRGCRWGSGCGEVDVVGEDVGESRRTYLVGGRGSRGLGRVVRVGGLAFALQIDGGRVKDDPHGRRPGQARPSTVAHCGTACGG